jgi:hypothetical protein
MTAARRVLCDESGAELLRNSLHPVRRAHGLVRLRNGVCGSEHVVMAFRKEMGVVALGRQRCVCGEGWTGQIRHFTLPPRLELK